MGEREREMVNAVAAVENEDDTGAEWVRPLPPADTRCAWCGLRLAAVPDAPSLWEGDWYHRRPCVAVARLRAGGFLPADYVPITELEVGQ